MIDNKYFKGKIKSYESRITTNVNSKVHFIEWKYKNIENGKKSLINDDLKNFSDNDVLENSE